MRRRCQLPPRLSCLIAACSSAACTLTAEPFEPSPVDRIDAELTPSAAGPPALPMPGSPSGAPAPSAAAEGLPDVRVDSASSDVGRLGATPASGATSESSEATAVDAGVGVSDEASNSAADAEAPTGEPCPSQTLGGSCYELFDDFVAWEVAEERCGAWGGHLASIESSEEDAFLDDWPAELGVPPGDGSALWLGGTDAALDGVFRWSNDTPLGYAGWAPNQPDNGVGVDCIAKRNDGSERWYDHRCADELRYVCERPL
jgi:hypothetical protein